MCPSFITGPFAVTSVSLENELMHHKIMTPAAQRHTRTHTRTHTSFGGSDPGTLSL